MLKHPDDLFHQRNIAAAPEQREGRGGTTNETKTKERNNEMLLTEKKSGSFKPHPPTDDPVKAVIVDVTPTKMMHSQYGDREVFKLVYETEVEDAENDNRRYCLWSRPYTPSLNEKANFRKDLKKIMGRDLTAQELEEFDTEGLIGKGVKLIVEHNEGTNGDTYANVGFIAPDKGEALVSSDAYTRVKDREDKSGDDGDGEASSYRKTSQQEGREDWQGCKVHVGKHSGVDLGDLDETAVTNLIDKWLPEFEKMEKPKVADKRLAAALEQAREVLSDLEDENPF